MRFAMHSVDAELPRRHRILLLRDADQNGVAEQRFVFLDRLNSPFGMALIGGDFYVAETDALVRFPYTPGDTVISAPAEQVTDLPAGEINHHWTKNVISSPDGRKLYVTVGSNSNVAENGIEREKGRAAIWEVDTTTGQKRIFATGIRKTVNALIHWMRMQPSDRGNYWHFFCDNTKFHTTEIWPAIDISLQGARFFTAHSFLHLPRYTNVSV